MLSIIVLSLFAVTVLLVLWASSTNNQPPKYQNNTPDPDYTYRPL